MRTAPGQRTAYINARLLDPVSGLDGDGAVLIEGHKILDAGANLFADGVPEDVKTIDCGAMIKTGTADQ